MSLSGSAENYNPHPDLISSYEALLDFRSNDSRQQVKEFITHNPQDKAFSIILLSLADIIEISLSDDFKTYKHYSENESEYLSALRSLDDSEWKNYALAEVRLHWSYVKFRMGDEIGGTIRLYKSWELIEKGLKENPEFLPYYRTSGVLNILLGAVPDKYSWFLNLFGIKASIQSGISDLQKCIDGSGSIFSLEASYILASMRAFIIPDITHVNHVGIKSNMLSNRLIIKYLNSLISIKTRNADRALENFNEFLVSNLPARFPVIYYWVAECYFKKGDYINAAVFYKSFLRTYRGKNLVMDAYYKLSNIYYLIDDMETARKYRAMADDVKGKNITAPDQNANQQIREGLWPEKDLYKARMAFDGGYYEYALVLLENYKTSHMLAWDTNEEYHYRLARIHHAEKQLTEAISAYHRTIELSEMKGSYFGPNSALNLGYIYADSGQTNKAREYFNKVLSYKGYGYKSSLDTQAKVALQVLEK